VRQSRWHGAAHQSKLWLYELALCGMYTREIIPSRICKSKLGNALFWALAIRSMEQVCACHHGKQWNKSPREFRFAC
jgi:hypothetical protein